MVKLPITGMPSAGVMARLLINAPLDDDAASPVRNSARRFFGSLYNQGDGRLLQRLVWKRAFTLVQPPEEIIPYF